MKPKLMPHLTLDSSSWLENVESKFLHVHTPENQLKYSKHTMMYTVFIRLG